MIPFGVIGSAHHYELPGDGGFAFIGGQRMGHSSPAKTVTIPSVPLGPDFPGRQVLIIILGMTSSTSGDVTSVTVGGVPFTIDITSGVTRNVVGFARGVVAGTTADVVATAGASTNTFGTASAMAVYSLPPAVVPVYTAGGTGTTAVYLNTALGGITVMGATRTVDPVSGLREPFVIDYNDSGYRFTGNVLGDSGDVNLSPGTSGNTAYNRVAGVTYA